MKKFRILLVDCETGHDLYNRFEGCATGFASLVELLDAHRVSYRLIEDITQYYLRGNFIPSPWSSIPSNAIRKS